MTQFRYLLLLLPLIIGSCNKAAKAPVATSCDMPAITAQNSNKVTISNGAWGTLSLKQGNCMPTTDNNSSTCTQCPTNKEIRFYNYTNFKDATYASGGYSSVNAQLIATVKPDANGFYQVSLPNNKYTVMIVDNGLLYSPYIDGNGGLSPVVVSNGKTNQDLVLDHAAY